MNKQKSHLIVQEILSQLNQQNGIPIGVSARHCHLCKRDLETLFGKGFELTKKSDLSQPGQFAANETVTIVGSKGSFGKVRILGPLRKSTQIEVSKTDSIKLGLNPPIRESGNIHGSSPITVVGPKGSVYLEEGLIIAQAHIHMAPDDARNFDIQDGEYVSVMIDNEQRPLRFDNVRIRVSPKFNLEMHIDTDEANAGAVTNGQKGRLIKAGRSK
jgi:putative phosphotransacetylase